MLCNEITTLKKNGNDQEVRHKKEIQDLLFKQEALNKNHAEKIAKLQKANDELI